MKPLKQIGRKIYQDTAASKAQSEWFGLHIREIFFAYTQAERRELIREAGIQLIKFLSAKHDGSPVTTDEESVLKRGVEEFIKENGL